jgi:hypothetical protein
MVRSSVKAVRHAHLARLIADWLNHCAPIVLAALAACTPTFSQADEQLIMEYRVKAAFLYNISRFVDWPEGIRQPDRLTICMLGINPFGDALDSIAGKAVHEDQLDILHLPGTAVTGECRIVFISNSESDRIGSILAPLEDRPVLTVSDSAAFAEEGGMIRLKLVNSKVRFDINIEAAHRAGLNISSKLLSLATIVRDGNSGEAQ